ncbi:MAG: acyltransferase [Bdellovibrionaceae bacterium]|nr:acyltransferase [Pseudobdellovibrionaceae bacterium]MBX3034557.1 acyltransferase [Pseudobdellovibrionaceae bacterium]
MKGTIAFSLIALNTVFWSSLLLPFAVLKFLIPIRGWQRFLTGIMVWMAENWISFNSFVFSIAGRTRWDVEGLEELQPRQSYLVSANHLSWTDIVVLQHVFNHRIPFLRFFLKKELMWVPFLGIAWWALDYPYMRRYSKEYLEKHPEKRGKDLEATRKACARFRGSPVSVLNFLEGTRFTADKHRRQQSPYRHLLRPKTGGLAFVLQAMGSQFHSLLDVTIVYPQGPVSFWDLCQGRLRHVIVRIREISIPIEFLGGDYQNDPVFREKIQNWVSNLWEEKDQLISSLKSGSAL